MAFGAAALATCLAAPDARADDMASTSPMYVLFAGEIPPAGYGALLVRRTSSIAAGGMLSARIRVDGQEVCGLARGAQCSLALREGEHEVAADHPATLGVVSGKLKVQAGYAYEVEVDSRMSNVILMGLARTASDTSAAGGAFTITNDSSNFSLSVRSAKEASADPFVAKAGHGSWEPRIALLRELKGRLTFPAAMAVLFEMPFGAERDGLLRQDADVRSFPRTSATALGRSLKGGIAYSYSWHYKDANGASRSVMERCGKRSEPGSCVVVLIDDELQEDALLSFAEAQRATDFGTTRAAYLQTMRHYASPKR